MTLEVTADPLVLERTVNRIIYGNGNGSNGNGYSGSSGGFLYESLDWTPSSDHVGDTSSLDPVSDDSSTTSRLSSILGPGALGAGAGSAAAAAFSSMLEMGDEQQSDFVPEGPDDFLPEPSPRESYSEPAPYEAPRNYEVEPSFEPSARADQEEMLPVARRSDIIEEDRDRPGERTILPGRFLTPGIKEGTYFATQYVDRRREDYESEELTESQQSGIYDRSEPVGADERLESVGAGSSDAPAAYESSSADAPNSSNDDSDFFPDEPVSSSMPPADDDDVPVEESRPSIGESIAAVAAAGTAFAAGAALAAARSTGPGSDFFSSTVPPASEAPQVVASVERVSSPEFIPAASSSPVPSAAAPVFSPAPAVSPPVPTGDFPDSPSPVAAVAPATFLPDSAPPFSPTPPITVTPQSVAPEPVAFQPQPQPSPGMMDFFTATGGGFMSGERNTAPIVHHSPAQEPSMFPSGAMDMMGGGTASIIQNAIQAGARASATQTSDSDGAPPQVDPFDKVDADTAARKKKKSEKARSKSASSSKDGKDGGSSASGAKSSKSKSSLAAARTKSGSKKKTEASEDDEGKNISIGGFSLPKKMAAIAACLIVFVAFPVCVLIGNVASLVGGLGSATSGGGVGGGSSAKGSSLTGNWQIAYMNPDGRQVDGIMSLQQKGDTIEGWGNDPKASFQVAGKLSQNPQGKVQIQLNKQYLNPQNQPLGKPIVYFGVIDGVNPQGPYFMHISGLWKFQKRQGYSWRAQIVELTGKWEAALTNPGSDQAAVAGQPTGPGVSVKSGNAGMPGPSDPKSAQGFFFNIAIGLLGVGGLIAFLSLWIFGPSGKLNILAKKEYIPSQFKPQHFKLVREMGRPL